MGSYFSPGNLNLIIKLRPVVLNFGKDFEVSSRIKNGSSFVVSDPEMFLLEEATSKSGSPCLQRVH